MEQHLKDALESLRKAQMEIQSDVTTYEQLDNLQFIICDMLEDKVWVK